MRDPGAWFVTEHEGLHIGNEGDTLLARSIHRSQGTQAGLTPGIWDRVASIELAALAVIVVASVVVRLHLIAHYAINWDEFGYLSHVHAYLRGDLGLQLQTFHVHFFGWLASVAPNEVDQIVAARTVMLGLQLITAWLLFRIARRITDTTAALFAVAAYLTFSFVIRGGASFRTDPIAICLIMAAADLLLGNARNVRRAAVAGFLVAVAAMITIKVSLFLPSLTVLLCVPLFYGRSAVEARRRLIASAAASTVGFALLYTLHGLSMDRKGPSTLEVASTRLSEGLIRAGFFPQAEAFFASLKWDMVYWAFLLVGMILLLARIRQTSGADRAPWIELAALVMPVATLAGYRNSYPYFYPFILAPASVLTALTWHTLTSRHPVTGLLKLFALAWLGSSLILHGLLAPRRMPLEPQRTVLKAIHRMFPAPVAYLDRCSMVSSFRQVGLFMSTWGMQEYLERGEPVLSRAVEEWQPPLLLANHLLLDVANTVYPTSWTYRPPLLAQDKEALTAAYIHHWGPIYVAGKRFEAPPAGQMTDIDLLIGGPYTVEARGAVRVDGQLVHPGQSLVLRRGVHRVTSVGEAQHVTLRWGTNLYRPAQAPPSRPLFLGF